jgi:hypothetical protein
LRTLGLELRKKVEEIAPALSVEIGKQYSGSKTLGQIARVIEKRTTRLRD